jgi:beta-barrel assembly-enhancing protease
VALGRQLAREVEAHYTMHPDEVVQTYVSDLGALIVEAAGNPRPEVPWSFRVIDQPEQLNAMALPGGWIYLYSGLLLTMETEAELVAVLAHEIAHVTLRHIAERLATMFGIEVLAAVALGQDPGTLERILATIFAQGYLLRYSRGQEREADSAAIEYAIAAGWDPRGLAWFFERLEDQPRPPEWLSTHPSPEARVEYVGERVAGREIPTRTGQERFEQVLERLRAREAISEKEGAAGTVRDVSKKRPQAD